MAVKVPKAITDMSTLSRVIFDPDTIPPPVPSNVTGTPFSSTRIDLAWAASVDTGGSGTIGYLVFRNGTQVGTASATAFSDTGLTASTTYTYRVAAVDAAGNVSAQSSQLPVTTQANVGPPVFAPVQPAVAFVGIAGVRTYTDPTQQAAIGRYNLFVMGASWEAWAASGRDLDVIAKAIKAASVAPGGMLLLNYQNLNAIEEDSSDPYPTWTAEVAARNWRLYVSGSTAPLVTPNSGGGATALVNYTTFVPLNPSLEYPYDFGAKYSYYKFLSKTKSDARFSGLAAGLASSTLDGVYQDNFLVNPQVNGDWNRDGTTEGQGWPSTETPWLQAGQLRYCLTMRALAPTKYIFVNGGDYGLVTPGVMSQQADGMLAESYMGKYWSWETQRGFTVMLGYYYKVLAAAASPHLVVFGGSWPDTNPDGSALTRLPTANGYPPLNTQWQWARYIAATALLGEGMHAINRLSQGYSSDLTALDWYDFDGGVNGLARGWLGAPVDALRPTTPKIAKGTIGIYGVEYQNGIVMANPVGNGTQTVVATDIPGNWKFLTGTQDPTRDSGATFVSVSIPERDGLFLQRVSNFTPMKLYSFNGLANGASITSLISFWGTFANGFGSKGDTSLAYGSNTSSCNCSVQAGNDGGTGGGTGPNGSFGFGVNFGGATVGEGEELWANVRMFVPLGFSFATNTGFLKFLRFEQSGSGGKLEHFILNGGFDGSASTATQTGWNLGDENFPNPQPDTCKKTAGLLTLGQWVSIECYFKASAVAANSIRRLWRNGVLQFEITGGKNTKWLTPAGTYSTGTLTGNEPVLVNATSKLSDMMFFTYWNGNAPQTQSINVQTIAFHKNSATLPFTDAFGNKLIGPVAF